MYDFEIIKSELEKMTCPEHGKNPSVELVPEGKLRLHCCCDPFKSNLTQRIESLIRSQTIAAIIG